MSEQPQQDQEGVREKRLANAFGVHRKIQSTLDDQEQDKKTDKRLAVFGISLLIIIALVIIYVTFFTEDTVTVIS